MVFLLYFFILFKSFNCYDIYNIDYLKILDEYEDFKAELRLDYEDCIKDIEKLRSDDKKSILRKNTKIVSSMGKGMDDIGDELECRKSNANTEYIFIKYYLDHYNDEKQYPLYNLTKYIERNYSFFGLCIPKNCEGLINDLRINKTIKAITKNETYFSYIEELRRKLKIYLPSDIKHYKLDDSIFWFFIAILGLKTIVGIYAKIKYPKGYSYHGFDLYLKRPENIGNINANEEEENEKDKLIEEGLINKDGLKNEEKNLGGDYNPIYDFEPFYPLYLRFIKYIDIFNNFFIFSRKRDRYYNEKGISIICSLKAVILYAHIYSEAIRVFIKMPNTSVFNYKFYNSFGLSFYKFTINSLNFWVILEAATFSFKLIKYIKKNFYLKRKNITNKKEKNIFIIKYCLKFLCFYIPKIISFIFVFIFFYYLFEHYLDYYTTKVKYKYIFENHIKRRECNNYDNFFKNIAYAFIPFVNYKVYNLEKYRERCYPFTYIYSNMFFSSIIFMALIIVIYYFENKIVDIIITIFSFLNIIVNYIIFFNIDNKFKYISIIRIEDNKNNSTINNISNKGPIFKYNETEAYTFFSHFTGEGYSIFYPHIFFSLFYLGCLLGLCFFYYNEYLINLKNKNKNKKKEEINITTYEISNTEKKRLSQISLSSFNSSESILDHHNIYEDDIFYKPMIFCQYLIIKLKFITDTVKITLLIIIFIIGAFICSINFILIIYYQSDKDKDNRNYFFDFDVKSTFHPFKLLYFSEKIIHNFLFVSFVCILLVLPKKYSFSKIMRSNAFLIIGRSGLFGTCLYQAMIYMLYCIFQIEIEIGNLMIFYIVLGLYIMIVSFSIFGNIIIELPFRIFFKNILKRDEKEEIKILLINMKNIEQMNK